MKFSLKKMMIPMIVVGLLISGCNSKEEKKEEKKVTINANEVYETPQNPTSEQAKVYNQLSKALEGDEEEKIAQLVGTSFAYDFFTLSNKKSESEVGGLTFIPEASREDFKQYAISYYYGNYATIVNQYSKDSLPHLKMHDIKKSVATPLIYNDLTYDGYMVTLSVKYKESELEEAALKTEMEIQVIKDVDGIFKVIAVN